MRFDVYIYQKTIIKDLEEIFEKLNNHTKIHYVNDHLMTVNVSLDFDEEFVDLGMVHASIMSDFGVDTTMVYVKDIVYKFIPESYIHFWIKSLNNDVYNVSDFLLEASKDKNFKMEIKRNLVNYLGQEMIDTIIMVAKTNMNFSVAAKKMYLHRNSLNYRIEKIHQMTDIDIKTFRGLRSLVSTIE